MVVQCLSAEFKTAIDSLTIGKNRQNKRAKQTKGMTVTDKSSSALELVWFVIRMKKLHLPPNGEPS